MTRRMVRISTNHPYLRFPRKDTVRVLAQTYRGERKELPVLAVVFTNGRFMRTINRKYLRHDYDTDVITFPLGSDGGVEGEIYINLDAARNQAREYGVPFTTETQRLLIHGALHLMGYRDASPRERARMRKQEDRYLELLNAGKISHARTGR